MIVKRFEAWCDALLHEPSGQELIAASSKAKAWDALREKGWTRFSGMDFCPPCSQRRHQPQPAPHGDSNG